MPHHPNEFLPVAELSDIPKSGMLPVEIDDRFLVLVQIDGQIYCLDDVCTHDGGPLGEGELVGSCLVCPRHGAQFDVRSGRAMTMPATESTATHSVKVDGGTVYVKLSD